MCLHHIVGSQNDLSSLLMILYKLLKNLKQFIFDEFFKTLLLKLQDINDSSSNRSVDMDISESAPTGQNVNQGSILREGNVGQITDTEVPLVHAVRLLCSRFLLTGHPMGLIPDRQVNAPLVK